MKGTKSIYFCAAVFMSIAVCIIGDSERCEDFIPTAALNPFDARGSIFPSEDELATVCPGIMKFIHCYEENPDEYPMSEPEEIIFNSQKRSFMDLCDEESDQRIKYLEHVECLKEAESLLPTCKSASEEGFELYRIDNVATFGDRECFQHSHVVGCMSVHILKSCGRSALSVYHNLWNKMRYLAAFCEPASAEDLRTKYLESLNLDEEVKKIYEEAFNLV